MHNSTDPLDVVHPSRREYNRLMADLADMALRQRELRDKLNVAESLSKENVRLRLDLNCAYKDRDTYKGKADRADTTMQERHELAGLLVIARNQLMHEVFCHRSKLLQVHGELELVRRQRDQVSDELTRTKEILAEVIEERDGLRKQAHATDLWTYNLADILATLRMASMAVPTFHVGDVVRTNSTVTDRACQGIGTIKLITSGGQCLHVVGIGPQPDISMAYKPYELEILWSHPHA
jgi:hypothetical protein